MDEYDRQPEGYEAHPSDQAFADAQGPAPQPTAYTASGHIAPTSVFCVQCGYNLTGVTIGSNCPECGRTVAPSFHSQMLPTSGKSVAALVLGICSIVGCTLYGVPSLICGPLAIIFAAQTRKQIADSKVGGASAGMATAGMICGIVGLALVLLSIAFVVVIIALDQ